jgi:hypothetical protein
MKNHNKTQRLTSKISQDLPLTASKPGKLWQLWASLSCVCWFSLPCFANTQVQANPADLALTPPAFSALPATALRQFSLPSAAMQSANRVAAASAIALAIPNSHLEIRHSQRHSNGDVTITGLLTIDGAQHHLVLTQGSAGAIGELRGTSHQLLLQQNNKLYIADLAAANLVEPSYERDLVTPATPHQHAALPALSQPATNVQPADGPNFSVVDVMLIYPPEVAQTYPNGLADTLMNQLVARANQAFVDSNIQLQLRLVHRQQVNYQQPSNFTALEDLQQALEPANRAAVEPSLANVLTLRNQYGADLVAMIRTHDLNERGVCGVAFFPGTAGDILINISNVGISGGSNCIDTFTHEVGHNFGAGHQYVNGQSVGARPAAGALIVPGKFNTIMSSIGTGDINRNYKLNRFSNPALSCAGVSCGDSNTANNAATVNYYASINAALRPAVSTLEVTAPPRSNIDSDGDGVTDLTDVFPHDRSEQSDRDNDSVGDNADKFPDNPAEQGDFDKDGIGDNADLDDDNDGTPDNNDALPFDASDNSDRDGDGVGDKTDQLPSNFQEVQDSDADGIGNRFDQDNDNDGVTDYDLRSNGKQQLAVVNAGSGEVLLLEPTDGRKLDVLYQAPAGGFSFRSDLVSLSPSQLALVQFSDVLRLDRQQKTSTTLLKRAAISSAFTVNLLKTGDNQSNSKLWLSNGLNPSTLESFEFGSSGMQGNSSKLRGDATYRDIMLLDSNTYLLVVRDTNQILSFNPATPNQTRLWASGTGLNKPEHLALASDGSVLVTNAGSRAVSRFSASGQYLGELISAGSGGLGMPACIGVDNSGFIYLCSSDNHQILKYSANGAPLAVLASGPTAGINQPVSLQLIGAPLDTAPLDPSNDSDGDGVANNKDKYPLDASRSVDVVNPPLQPDPPATKSGGASGFVSLLLGLMLCWRRRLFVTRR